MFLDKPIANTIADARAITEACRKASVVLALGYQRRRESHFRWIKEIDDGSFGRLVNAEANISRDRLGKIDLSSWRYTAEGHAGRRDAADRHPLHRRARVPDGTDQGGERAFVQLVLPGDNPDVASLVLEHENGALSTLNASYASASEYYLMNIYGKEASAYYDLHQGLRVLKRGSSKARAGAVRKNDPIVEELEEFAGAGARRRRAGDGRREGTASLAVLLAGIKSAREGRRVEVKEKVPGMKDGRNAVLLHSLFFGALAQEPPFPQRGPLEITVLFPAGSSADVTARLLADGMSRTSASACWW